MKNGVALPEIRINFAYLLYFGESQKIAGENKLETYEQYTEWTLNYRKEWRKFESKILKALLDKLELAFYLPIIDVSCAPYFIPKSDPLIMNFSHEPDKFVDVLTHELIHLLLTDNNIVRTKDAKPVINLFDEWKKLFRGNYDFSTLVHIPVHAISKYIYLDVLHDPSRLQRDIDSAQKLNGAKAYIDSWDYVNNHDYHQIVNDLSGSYQEANI